MNFKSNRIFRILDVGKKEKKRATFTDILIEKKRRRKKTRSFVWKFQQNAKIAVVEL